jgi:glycosyltransferase involved in cell wall biosynthesis
MSDDGTYQALLDFAATVPVARVVQAERDGIYPNFNRSIRLAAGDYVYIATSDDTMAADCLEKLVAALDDNPDCDLAHCPMRVMDESGGPAPDWWSGHSLFVRSSGELATRRHKRVAPLDGMLCLLGDNIYSSVTQILIRRSLFDRIGYYRSDWGSVGDFHWNLRAGLAASAIHVPDTWGGWRMHRNQATAAVRLRSPEHQALIDGMIDDVIAESGKEGVSNDFIAAVGRAAQLREHLRKHSSFTSPRARRWFLIREALKGKPIAWKHLLSAFRGQGKWPKAAPAELSGWFAPPLLVPLD